MTLSELHPDELLWRDACGTLTAGERADLTAHLERCPACALERAVRVEAARARVPSETDHAIAARLVDRVLATHERRPTPVRRAGWRRPLAVAAAAIVLVAGTAFGATALVARVRAQRAAAALAFSRQAPPEARSRHGAEPGQAGGQQLAEREAPAREVPRPRASAPLRDRRAGHESARSLPRSQRATALAHAHAPAAPRLGSPPAEPPPRPATGDAPGGGSLPGPAPVEAAAAVVAKAPHPPAELPPPEAAHLLRQAEQARTARQWSDAGRAFAELGRQYAGTREEVVGRALYGQLLLDHLDEPRRALTMFERYLAVDSSGALAEEARLGRAQALRRLDRSQEERGAWLELLRRHPGSVHAAAARTRLAALDAL
jgi:hypothetical protein